MYEVDFVSEGLGGKVGSGSYCVLLVRQEVSHMALLTVCDGNGIPSWNIGFVIGVVTGVVICQLAIEGSDS
jgi:hypothetical protein